MENWYYILHFFALDLCVLTYHWDKKREIQTLLYNSVFFGVLLCSFPFPKFPRILSYLFKWNKEWNNFTYLQEQRKYYKNYFNKHNNNQRLIASWSEIPEIPCVEITDELLRTTRVATRTDMYFNVLLVLILQMYCKMYW